MSLMSALFLARYIDLSYEAETDVFIVFFLLRCTTLPPLLHLRQAGTKGLPRFLFFSQQTILFNVPNTKSCWVWRKYLALRCSFEVKMTVCYTDQFTTTALLFLILSRVASC